MELTFPLIFSYWLSIFVGWSLQWFSDKDLERLYMFLGFLAIVGLKRPRKTPRGFKYLLI